MRPSRLIRSIRLKSICTAEDLQHTDGVLFGLTSDSSRGRLLEPDCPDSGATALGELPGEFYSCTDLY